MSTGTTGVYVYQQICKTSEEWAADTSIFPENIWLFERKPNGDIVTKLSDGEKPYSQLREYGLSAYISAKIGGYTGSEKDFYKLIGTIDRIAEEVKANKYTPIHKSITVLPSDWTIYEETGMWRALVTDEKILENSAICGGVDANDSNSYSTWENTGGISGVFDSEVIGQFYIYAKRQPKSNINYKYTIL